MWALSLCLLGTNQASIFVLVQVLEETGYDASGSADEKDVLTLYLNGQQSTMYIVTGVDEEFPFEPQVSQISWPVG